MSEKINADIHDSMDKRTDKQWIRDKILQVYTDTNEDLKSLKSTIIDTNKMEEVFTMDHVKKVLESSVSLMNQIGYKKAVEQQSAGLTLSIQIALMKLGEDPGALDGVYMNLGDRDSKNPDKYKNSKTRLAVKSFQAKNGLEQDGRAGPLTIAKMLEKLGATVSNNDQQQTQHQEEGTQHQEGQNQQQEEQTQQQDQQTQHQEGQTSSEIITPTGEAQERPEQGILTGNELANENYESLKNILIGMNGETITALGELQNLQETTKTKLFCFEEVNQKQIEQMLAPVLLASGDMPINSVQKIIDTDTSGCVSYSIKDITGALNAVIKEGNNADNKYLFTASFKQFCKYLLDTNMIIFENGQYKDNPSDQKDFVNVLFAKVSDEGSAEVSIINNGQTIKKYMDIDEAQHELYHADFEAHIANNQSNYNELRTYFFKPENIATVQTFLKAIYSNDDFSYTWHFTEKGDTAHERLEFIDKLPNNSDLLQQKIKTDKYTTGNAPEFNLLSEFWAYSHEKAPATVDLHGHKFTREIPQNNNEQTITNPETIDYLDQIKNKYQIEPASFITGTAATKEGDKVILKGKLYDKNFSITFNQNNYANPQLQDGANDFNFNLEGTKITLTNKQNDEEVQNINEQLERDYKNSEFVFEEHIHTGIKEIFNKNKINNNFLIQLESDIVNQETKVEVNGINKSILNLKDDLTENNNNSIDLHFSKIKGNSVNFMINIVKSDVANGKKFTLKRINRPTGDSINDLNEIGNIINRISAFTLPQGWAKPENPVVVDTQQPLDIHLKVIKENKDYQIHFDKDGNIKKPQELITGTVPNQKTYIVDLTGNQITLTEKVNETVTPQKEIEQIIRQNRYHMIGQIESRGGNFIVTISSSEEKNNIKDKFTSKGFLAEIEDTSTNSASAFKKYKLTLTKLSPEQIEANKRIDNLRNEYIFDDSIDISSVEESGDKFIAKCNGFDLQFNKLDYASPVIIYQGKNYPIVVTTDSYTRKQYISLKVENIPSLVNIGEYRDKISIGSSLVPSTDVVFDLSTLNTPIIKFTYANNNYDLIFTKEGNLKTQFITINGAEQNVLITPDKKIKIEDASRIKLSFIKDVINDFGDIYESDSFLKIRSDKNIFDLVGKYESYIVHPNRTTLKNTLSQMDNKNTIKSEFNAMVRKMDLLVKYKSIAGNEQLLKDKGYEIVRGSNGNITSLKRKPLVGSEKIYISTDTNNNIIIAPTIDQINQDLNRETFAVDNEALRTTITNPNSNFLEDGITFENLVNTVNGIGNKEVKTDIQNFLKDGNIVLAQEYLGMYRNSKYSDNEATGKINQYTINRLAQTGLLEKGEKIKNRLPSDLKDKYTDFLTNNLNNGRNYALISKKDYTLYMFNADHKLLSSHPVLLGKNKGDQIMELKPEGSIFTTPGGIYTIDARTQKGEYAGPGDFLQLKPKDRNYPVSDFSIGIHTYYAAAGERENLLEKTSSNKRVTNGCINTLLEGSVYDNLSVGSTIYVAKES